MARTKGRSSTAISPPTENKRSKGGWFLAFAFALLVTVILLFIIFPPKGNDDDDDDHEETGPWKDLSKFKNSISEVETFHYYEYDDGASELYSVADPESTVYMLIGIEKSMNSTDLPAIRDFVQAGGHVIVADDGTNAERLVDFLEAAQNGRVNFTGKRYLCDKLFTDPDGTDPGYVHNYSFIMGRSYYIGGRSYNLLTHAPNGLELSGSGEKLVAATKELTVIDMNMNWMMDLEDEHAPYGPIAVEFEIGDNGGKIQYFSTTGLFTDNVFSLRENEEFIRADIFSMIPNGGDVILDQSKQAKEYSPHDVVIPE